MSFENAVRLGHFEDFEPSMFETVLYDIFVGHMAESWRGPDYHVRLLRHDIYDSIFKWHTDGLGYGPLGHRWIVIWSNHTPTEFVLPDCDDVVRPNPGDVILFNNREMKHRTPAAARGSHTRKFWRVTLSNRTEITPEAIERWRSELTLLQS